MKAFLVIAMLIALTAPQTTVTPMTQACVCANLLNQADCFALSGCTWTEANTTNTTTAIASGTCSNSTTAQPNVKIAPNFCGQVINATVCAGTLGCAFLNSTCQIFTGCSAYVQTTNAACQAISKQCTTDGIRCVQPGACSTYITQTLCTGNIAISGALQCKWTAGEGSSGTCVDMTCVDAPTTFTTLALCQGWINTCISTGKGCIAPLGSCSSYTIATGCIGMIGSDGTCTASTFNGATVCRPIACTDAPANTATNTACNTFLSGCVTTGKGCVSVLSACNSYAQTLICPGLLGSDGPCVANFTQGSFNCKATACTDAPASTTSDAACNTFKTGCQTTGSGCVSPICSSYTTKDDCLGGGSDGQCAFTPGTNTPNVGTCAQFTSCASANSDSVTCGSRTDACFFDSTTANGTTTTSCSSHTCATKALGSTCQAIPSFDLSTYAICFLTGTTCAAGNPKSFTAAQCYGNSVKTYTWNPLTSTCQSCQTQTQQNNTNPDNNTNKQGQLICLLISVTLVF